MSLSLEQVEKAASELQQLVAKKEVKSAQAVLSKLKLALTSFQLMPPFAADKALAQRQLSLARHVLEQATLLSVISANMVEFERHMNQVKPYYLDFQKLLPPSDSQWPILGLHLMFLLASNKLSEFHTELELIPHAARQAPAVQFPVSLEQYLMEGSYNKVLTASRNPPSPFFAFFLDILAQTVREKISTCAEKAYESLPLADASKLLMFSSEQETLAYAAKREWKVEQGVVRLPKPADRTLEIPAMEIAKQSLDYATELERIV